jgi:hypothetical protein
MVPSMEKSNYFTFGSSGYIYLGINHLEAYLSEHLMEIEDLLKLADEIVEHYLHINRSFSMTFLSLHVHTGNQCT